LDASKIKNKIFNHGGHGVDRVIQKSMLWQFIYRPVIMASVDHDNAREAAAQAGLF
jgi:hypothetical protein